MKALEILKAYARCREEERILMYPLKEVNEAIAELEALETKDTQSMTREEARKLIDKHSKKDDFGVGIVSKKVAYIIADYLPKDKQ